MIGPLEGWEGNTLQISTDRYAYACQAGRRGPGGTALGAKGMTRAATTGTTTSHSRASTYLPIASSNVRSCTTPRSCSLSAWTPRPHPASKGWTITPGHRTRGDRSRPSPIGKRP